MIPFPCYMISMSLTWVPSPVDPPACFFYLPTGCSCQSAPAIILGPCSVVISLFHHEKAYFQEPFFPRKWHRSLTLLSCRSTRWQHRHNCHQVLTPEPAATLPVPTNASFPAGACLLQLGLQRRGLQPTSHPHTLPHPLHLLSKGDAFLVTQKPYSGCLQTLLAPFH